jgi:N-ethylmaleimide reductase
MVPLTRARNARDLVPTPIMVEYYVQCTSAGLIVSKAISRNRLFVLLE